MKKHQSIDMKITYYLLVVCLLFSLVSCSTVLTNAPFPTDEKIRNHFSKLSNYANDTFVYALMSSNAYNDSTQFIIPNWKRVQRLESLLGLEADVYEYQKEGKLERIVIAFRGTEASWSDWVYGNLNWCFYGHLQGQYGDAEDVYLKVSNIPKYNKIPIAVTCHSLGGGLAIHLSLLKDIDAYVFNPSPRICVNGDKLDKQNNNKRVVISETGEILHGISNYSFNFQELSTDRGNIDLLEGGSVKEHNMYDLARALTKLATIYDNIEAHKVMEINRVAFNFH